MLNTRGYQLLYGNKRQYITNELTAKSWGVGNTIDVATCWTKV